MSARSESRLNGAVVDLEQRVQHVKAKAPTARRSKRSTSWADRPLLAIDTETTGTDPFNARIVQMATALIDPSGRLIDSWETIVDPGVPIPDDAAEIHGIDTELAATEGVPTAQALMDLAGRLWEHLETWQAQAPVVMYNARFDWPLVLAEVERHRIEFPSCAPILDPLVLDRAFDQFRRGGRRLTVVAGHYGVDLSEADAHGALADAVAAGRVMRRLIDQFPTIRSFTLAGLWLHQTHAHEDFRQWLVDVKRRHNDPGFDIPAGWPVPVERERRRS